MNTAIKALVALLSVSTLYFGFLYSGGLMTSDADDPVFNTPEYNTESVPAQSVPASSLADFNDAIVDIAERTNPTVVTITTTQMVRQQQMSPFSFFFDDPRFNQEQEYERKGLGSGVVISEDGYILTNNHVVAQADEISIQMYDGREMTATIVGTDPRSDIAVLKVESSNLPAIPMGDSDATRVGEMVLAIGSPLDANLAHTVSMGIVSAKERQIDLLSVEGGGYENFIQTDAAINPGNSGGALISMNGELVGINTAIASQTGGSMGIGFAIPINLARSVMESIIEHGRVVRAFIGIDGRDLDRPTIQALDLDQNYGVMIHNVIPDTPAESAGLEAGDIILDKDGAPIRNYSQFRLEIAGSDPGSEVELDILRDGERETVTVTLGEMPEEGIASSQGTQSGNMEPEVDEAIGFQVSNLTQRLQQQLRLPGSLQGVVVMDINQRSPAYSQGLRQGDVITEVQYQPVTNVEEFSSAINDIRDQGRGAVLLRINRGGDYRYIAFDLE